MPFTVSFTTYYIWQQASFTLGLIYHRVFVLWSLSRVHLTENRLVIGARKSWVGTQNVLPKFSETMLSTIGCCYSRTHAVVVTIILGHKQFYVKYNFRLQWSLSSRNLQNAYFIIFEHVRQACQHFTFPAVSPNSPVRRSTFIPLGCHPIANVYTAEYARSVVSLWRRDDDEERRRVGCFRSRFCATLNILLWLHAFAKGAEFCCSRIFFCCTNDK
jgi:hypothetical protein